MADSDGYIDWFRSTILPSGNLGQNRNGDAPDD